MFEANDATRIFPCAKREDRAERLADEPLGARVARALGVRRVAEQEVDAAVPDLRERADVGLEPVDRRVVELPVARVHDAPGVRLDDERDGVGDRVRDADELDAKRAELERRVARRRGHELGLLPEPVLVELRLDERERERRRDDLADVDLAQEVRQPADVILVAVREDDRAHAPALEVADVGQEQVDAEVLVAREREPGVDDDDLVAHLVDGHVLPDLAEAAERDDAERVAHAVSLRSVYSGNTSTAKRSPSTRSACSATESCSSASASSAGSAPDRHARRRA